MSLIERQGGIVEVTVLTSQWLVSGIYSGPFFFVFLGGTHLEIFLFFSVLPSSSEFPGTGDPFLAG